MLKAPLGNVLPIVLETWKDHTVAMVVSYGKSFIIASLGNDQRRAHVLGQELC